MLETCDSDDEIEGFLFESFQIMGDVVADECGGDMLRSRFSAHQLLCEAQQILGDIDSCVIDLHPLECHELSEQSSASAAEFQDIDRFLSAGFDRIQKNIRISPMLVSRVIIFFRVSVIEFLKLGLDIHICVKI